MPESTALRELKAAIAKFQTLPPDAQVRVRDVMPTVKRALEHSEKIEHDAAARNATVASIAAKLAGVVVFVATLTLVVVVITAIAVSRTSDTTDKVERQQQQAQVSSYNGRVFACTERERLKLAIRLVATPPLHPIARELLRPYDPSATTMPTINEVCQRYARESLELR